MSRFRKMLNLVGDGSRKAVREWKHEKRRYEFIKVRKQGGGARERERRRIGGFHTLHRHDGHSS